MDKLFSSAVRWVGSTAVVPCAGYSGKIFLPGTRLTARFKVIQPLNDYWRTALMLLRAPGQSIHFHMLFVGGGPAAADARSVNLPNE